MQDHPIRPPNTARAGPRPLALHLVLLAAMTSPASFGVSQIASTISKAASRTWSGNPAGPDPEALASLFNPFQILQRNLQAEPTAGSVPSLDPEMAALLAGSDPADLAQALDEAARRRWGEVLDGIFAYRRHPYRRAFRPQSLVWQEGTTRLLDSGGRGRPVLVVPSMINRASVLDLMPEQSFLGYLSGAGLRPFLLDWDRPGDTEKEFDLTAYIAGRLEEALDRVLDLTGERPVVVGYCMGGTLATGLAHRRQRDLAGLVTLATPWDFHAEISVAHSWLPLVRPGLEQVLQVWGMLPTDIIQALFVGLDPALAVRKFRAFGRLDPASDRAVRFVALEDWLNDGVPLAGPVARQCFDEWYGENRPAKGTWRIAGRAVLPEEIRVPTLAVVPSTDRIVPPTSAIALADRLPICDRITPALGHIGMMASRKAERGAWRPIVDWIGDLG
ncbi:MAG: alpha/beta fold hydrolase [Alphaproteobacteria bacterium]|nr:alpha/beta fold hydrolase [Alphaproteobacteria bacterium]